MTDLVTIDDVSRARTRAADLDRDIREVCRRIRVVWTHLAADLYEFHQAQGWEPLGHASFAEWLAQPDIDLGYRQAVRMIEAHRELVIERALPIAQLEDVEITKLAVVMPAIKRGDTEVAAALADARTLSRNDLTDKYVHGRGNGPLDAEQEPGLHTCSCGHVHRNRAEVSVP